MDMDVAHHIMFSYCRASLLISHVKEVQPRQHMPFTR